jgi:hypothetical protein
LYGAFIGATLKTTSSFFFSARNTLIKNLKEAKNELTLGTEMVSLKKL